MLEEPILNPLRRSPEDLYQQFIDTQDKLIQSRDQRRQKKLLYRDEEDDDDGSEDAKDLFELAGTYEYLTQAHLQVMMAIRAKRSLTDDDAKICKKLEVMLKEERNTWSIVKSLFKEQLFTNSHDDPSSRLSDLMDDSSCISNQDVNCVNGNQMIISSDTPCFSEDHILGNFYLTSTNILRMQVVVDWLEANEAHDLNYKDEEDKVEFYSEGPTAWEATMHALKAKYNIHISHLDMTINPDAGIELCPSMDPDAPIRTKKSLAHSDKEVEIRLFKHLFRFIRAGKLEEGQELAQRVGYFWLAAALDGWLPHSDPNLDAENLGETIISDEISPVTGNKKRNVWRRMCFKAARVHGLNSYEKAIQGVFGGNLKSVLPICDCWADQLWARVKCSIEVKIEKAMRSKMPREKRDPLEDFPQEFYDNYQDIDGIFESISDQKLLSPFKEATIHQTVQKYLILNDIDGLLAQLSDWCEKLEYDDNLAENDGAISPHFLRCFAHIVLFLREIRLVTKEDARGTKIIESYIKHLTQQKLIESVAHYTTFLPDDNQVLSYARLLATISDREERKHCLRIAKDSGLNVNEITQTVVEIIMAETGQSGDSFSNSFASNLQSSMSNQSSLSTATTAADRRKIDSLDYLLYLDTKNYVAILHLGNILLRNFALQRKLEGVKETLFKLPNNLAECAKTYWVNHTNSDITLSLNNNLRELEGFRYLIRAHDELSQWSDWNIQKPKEPKKPEKMSKFCDNVNYEQKLKQYQQDLSLWRSEREGKTNSLTATIIELFRYSGGWMKDLEPEESEVVQQDGGQQRGDVSKRVEQMERLRKIYIPQMTTICLNVLQLTNRYEDCLSLSHLLADENLKLYDELSKVQLRDFLDRLSEVTKIIVRKTISES